MCIIKEIICAGGVYLKRVRVRSIVSIKEEDGALDGGDVCEEAAFIKLKLIDCYFYCGLDYNVLQVD